MIKLNPLVSDVSRCRVWKSSPLQALLIPGNCLGRLGNHFKCSPLLRLDSATKLLLCQSTQACSIQTHKVGWGGVTQGSAKCIPGQETDCLRSPIHPRTRSHSTDTLWEEGGITKKKKEKHVDPFPLLSPNMWFQQYTSEHDMTTDT